MIYTYRIDLPPIGLGQNSRAHWARKSSITAGYREHVWASVLQQGYPAEPFERAHIEIRAYICRRRIRQDDRLRFTRQLQYRPRDETNMADALKPAIDALQGLVIVDDSAKRCRVEMPRIIEIQAHEDERVEIDVEEA